MVSSEHLSTTNIAGLSVSITWLMVRMKRLGTTALACSEKIETDRVDRYGYDDAGRQSYKELGYANDTTILDQGVSNPVAIHEKDRTAYSYFSGWTQPNYVSNNGNQTRHSFDYRGRINHTFLELQAQGTYYRTYKSFFLNRLFRKRILNTQYVDGVQKYTNQYTYRGYSAQNQLVRVGQNAWQWLVLNQPRNFGPGSPDG